MADVDNPKNPINRRITILVLNQQALTRILGKSDAAVTDNYLLKLLPPGITGQVRSIYQAPPLPAPAIVANLRTPAEVAERFRQALLQLRGTQPALLDSILMPDLTDADLERDYGSVGKLLATEGGDEAR